MTTKKDLVEAHSFSRRRLVTAFLSGAPGGREVEPSRPGRTIFGGAAIAVLLVAGAAVASVLSPRTAEDWDARGLVVTEAGTRYVVTAEEEPLRPVANLTSAQLLFGLDLSEATTQVSQETLAEEPVGQSIGILGAPEELPRPDEFIDTGWTACTATQRGVAVSIRSTPDVRPAGRTGFIVSADGGDSLWLLAQGTTADGDAAAYRYPLEGGDGLIEAIFPEGRPDTLAVSQAWLNLFTESTVPLAPGSLGVEAGGETAYAGEPGAPDGVRTGDVLELGEDHYLVTAGGWARLTPFQWRVYGTTGVEPLPITRLSGSNDADAVAETDWPTGLLTGGRDEVCAQLDTSLDPAGAQLATEPGPSAWPADDAPAPGEAPVHVEPGHGAYVHSGDASTPFIVDGLGVAHQLQGPTTVDALGLGGYAPPVVSDAWVEILGPDGVPLSTELALCPPVADVSRLDPDTCASPGE